MEKSLNQDLLALRDCAMKELTEQQRRTAQIKERMLLLLKMPDSMIFLNMVNYATEFTVAYRQVEIWQDMITDIDSKIELNESIKSA